MARKKKYIQAVAATAAQPPAQTPCASFLRKLLPRVVGWLCLLVTIAFLTLTYDSAHVKLTLFQIGSAVLLTLWAALKITQKKNPLTKRRLLFLAPFIIYGLWQLVAFCVFPYKWEALEETVRLVLFGGVFTLVACEFNEQDIRTVTKFIIISAWISFLYAMVQTLAIWWPGLDIMQWRGFFGKRVFSTHANPNFYGDFVVFASCIIGADYFLRRKKANLVLLALGLITLIFSETKGAWLAYAGTLVVAAAIFTNFFFKGTKKQVRIINVAALAVLVGAIAFTSIYASKRFQSVSFRAHTWSATWQMIKDSPILGTGPGSFKIIYPKYRHPQIFYIENAHNNETQHAENEYLEQAVSGGFVGLLLFLGMFGFLLFHAYKKLKSSAPDSTRLYVAGYACAVIGILLHATVDISVHFVSSGFLLSVFMGILVALTGPAEKINVSPEQEARFPRVLKIFQVLLLLGLVTAAAIYTARFYQMMHTMLLRQAGEILLAVIAWGSFVLIVGGILYIYAKTALLTKRLSVIVLLALSLLPVNFFYNMFCANHFYSVGVALVRLNSPQGALDFLTKAIRANPLQVEYRQYRGNILAARLDLSKRLDPLAGDTKEPSNDYARAIADFKTVLDRAPYHALIHHNAAQLYYSMGVHYVKEAQNVSNPQQFYQFQQLASENFSQAKSALERGLKIDPVNVNSYILLISIALMAHDPDTAQYWIDTYRQGPDGVTEEEFLARHRNNAQIDFLQKRVQDLRAQLGQKS